MVEYVQNYIVSSMREISFTEEEYLIFRNVFLFNTSLFLIQICQTFIKNNFLELGNMQISSISIFFIEIYIFKFSYGIFRSLPLRGGLKNRQRCQYEIFCWIVRGKNSRSSYRNASTGCIEVLKKIKEKDSDQNLVAKILVKKYNLTRSNIVFHFPQLNWMSEPKIVITIFLIQKNLSKGSKGFIFVLLSTLQSYYIK